MIELTDYLKESLENDRRNIIISKYGSLYNWVFENYIKEDSSWFTRYNCNCLLYKEYKDLIEFYGGENNVPLKYFERIRKFEFSNYIEENLQLHDYKILIRKLKELYDINIIAIDKIEWNSIKTDKVWPIKIIFDEEFLIKDIEHDERLKNLLSFFNYFIREIDENKHYVILEPKFSTIVNKYVYSECEGILYHVTTVNNIERILKYGLKVKDANRINKKYPKRIYCLATDKIALDRLNQTYLKTIIGKIFNRKVLFKDTYAILQINLN